MCDGGVPPIIRGMLMTGSPTMDAQRAFARASRARRRAAVRRAFTRRSGPEPRLPVLEPRSAAGPGGRVREIPLACITGTLEPGRAGLFDGAFRPAPAAARRWQGLWLAEQRGQVLPPISVVRVGGGYAVRDGHHRVSVARARGGVTIDAHIEG
jgi:hypothetical protein